MVTTIKHQEAYINTIDMKQTKVCQTQQHFNLKFSGSAENDNNIKKLKKCHNRCSSMHLGNF